MANGQNKFFYRGSPFVWVPFVIISLFLGYFVLSPSISRLAQAYAPPVSTSISPPSPLLFCESLPTIGTTSILDSAAMQKNNVAYGIMSLRNEQPVTVVALLMDLAATHNYQVITVASDSTTQIKIPSGQYGFGIMSGRNWCNLKTGFTDGTRHQITGGVTIKADATTQAIIGTSPVPGQISVTYRNLYRENIQRGGLEVSPNSQGSYITSGSVNGILVPFMIDTGANGVALSLAVAQQAGIGCAQQIQSSTANGTVIGCQGIATEIRFGPFRLTNIAVHVLPNLTTGALLGMDVLRRFNMVWRGDKVRIVPIDSVDQNPMSGTQPQPMTAFATLVPWVNPVQFTQQYPQQITKQSWTQSLLFWLFSNAWYFYVFLFIVWLVVVACLHPFLKWLSNWNKQQQPAPCRNLSTKNDCNYNPKEFRADRTN